MKEGFSGGVRVAKFLMGTVGLVALLCLAAVRPANADSVYSNVTIDGTATAATNAVFGCTPIGSSCIVTGGTVDFITSGANAGLTITTPGNIFTVTLVGANILTGAGGTPVNTSFTSPSDSACYLNSASVQACNSGTTPTDYFTVTVASPDVLTVSSNSIIMSFSLPGGTTSAPEPSSLLLLGAGLAAFGILRRRQLFGQA